MAKEPQRSAPGWLAGLQRALEGLAVLLAVLGGLAVVGGGGLLLWTPELRGFALATVAVGGALLALALLASLAGVRAALTGRRGRYALNTLALAGLATAILVLVNLIAYQRPLRWDLTASRQFTLSRQTVQVLESLPEPVQVTGFFVPTREGDVQARRQAEDLLFEFRRRSGGRISYRFVDPEKEPSKARAYNLNRYPALVFETLESGRRHAILVPPVTEPDLVSALLVVTGVRQKKVYFLTGHGERDLTDMSETGKGIGLAVRGALRDNYQVAPLNLREAGQVPEDTAVLVVAGPTRDLLSDERKALEAWLLQGGRALFLLDPDTPVSFRGLLEQWGLRLGPGTVVDPASSVTGDPRTPLVQRGQYAGGTEVTEGGAITQPLDVTFFPEATAVRLVPELEERLRRGERLPNAYTPLVLTTGASFLTRDRERNTYLPDRDEPGPHILAMAVEATATVDGQAVPLNRTTRLVVIGDSDFASNRYYGAFTNADLFHNAINWLAEDYRLISIRPKVATFRQLVLTRREFDFIRFSSWFLLPAVVVVLAVLVWWRRR